MIIIDKKALEKIKEIFLQKKIPTQYKLRIGIKGGACSEDYFMGFDIQKENDVCFEEEGIEICVDKKQLLYLLTTKLNYSEQGFFFEKIIQTN